MHVVPKKSHKIVTIRQSRGFVADLSYRRKRGKMNVRTDKISISKFAEGRGLKRDTVNAYIRRNPDLFSGHTEQTSEGIFLDEAALDILDQKYPLPSPVEVIKDTKSLELLVVEQKKSAELQEKVFKLQQELNDTKLLLTKKEDEMLRLEDKAAKAEEDGNELKEKVQAQDQELREKGEELIRTSVTLDFTQKELDQSKMELEKEKERTAAAKEELQRMKEASFWKRLTGKW